MEIIHSRCCGLDVHKKQVTACLLIVRQGNQRQKWIREFVTYTQGLEHLGEWLLEHGVERVAMEATGIYWIPLYELLEARGIEVVLVNARQLSHVPGRKTDMLDCQWLQLLHSCGLLRGSFRPIDIYQWRTRQRERAHMVQEATRAVQGMQKALDQMNVQVHRALSDLTGKTGLAMVGTIVQGERDPFRLAAFRDKRCQKSEAQIAEHLTGNWRQEHLFNLRARELKLTSVNDHQNLTFFEQLPKMRTEIACQQSTSSARSPPKCLSRYDLLRA